jgi:hypothetical protein
MLTKVMIENLKAEKDGKKLFQRIEKAFHERKIDNDTRLDSYAYWAILNGKHGKWDNRFADRPEEHPFFGLGQQSITLEDVEEVFEIEN